MENNNKQKTNKKPWLIRQMCDDIFIAIFTEKEYANYKKNTLAFLLVISVFFGLDFVGLIYERIGMDLSVPTLFFLASSVTVLSYILMIFFVIPLKKISKINDMKNGLKNKNITTMESK